jgi:hypothetical protein
MVVRLFLLGCATVVFGFEAVAQEKAISSAEARQACEKFEKALSVLDLEAAMKAAAVPYFEPGYRFYSKGAYGVVLPDEACLRAWLKTVLGEIKRPSKEVLVRVSADLTYEEVLAKQKISGVKFADGKSVRSQLDAVLKKGDRLVMVHTTRDGRESSGNVLMVGIRDGAPKVIGYGDARYFPSLAPSEK